jgi:hypothetical protein
MTFQAEGAMKPSGGVSPARAMALILVPEIIRKSSLRSGIVVIHAALLQVVGGHLEWNNLELGQTRCHGEHLGAVRGVVDVLLGVGVRHASGVTANNVVVGTSGHTSLCVPLDLGGARVHHWRGEDGNEGILRVKDLLVQDGGVLLHSPGQGHIIILRPATCTRTSVMIY